MLLVVLIVLVAIALLVIAVWWMLRDIGIAQLFTQLSHDFFRTVRVARSVAAC
jgi:hypothetical protein